MTRPAFWTSILEEMHRAMHDGTTYRFRGMVLTEEFIARARAAKIARFAYARLTRSR